MSYININRKKIPTGMKPSKIANLCPFGSIQADEKRITIDEGCRMCKLCVKNGPKGLFEFREGFKAEVDKNHSQLSDWSGIAVFVEIDEGKIHPVSLELLGKGAELAEKSKQDLIVLLAGDCLDEAVEELRFYGIDRISVYDAPELREFRIEPYTAAMEDFINMEHPSVFLVGGTTIGRNLAPRTAARFRTGLTADCTVLDITREGELIQIRPAFGGNIMAQIKTPHHRPQFATVRYKIFSPPGRNKTASGSIRICHLPSQNLTSTIQIIDVIHKEKVKHLEDAEVIVALGRGLGKVENLVQIERLAELLGAEIAGTRPMIEDGIIDPRKQIGLSGRTVRPKLILTCGISGSVQFAAGMKGSDKIIAINSDPDAPIFKIAHIGIVGNMMEIIPALIQEIEGSKKTPQEANRV
ncbi:MAG: electron transfer flavoprotein subunit alpha [Spirochaetales bacterium]|nr:electron transfer flavoprotein subunit alpha [Spirochaetales bacterium]